MHATTTHFETLKLILRQARHPDLLDDHPWTRSLLVHEALESCPELAQASPGQQLIGALAGLFPQLQPSTPPRAGKRLDPRWGEFGLLAALYFTPFNHGTSFPTSLLDAWGRIDCAILHFVFGAPAATLSDEQVEKYRLVGADVDYGSASTLSDWHRKGLQRFTEIVLNRERCLSRTSAKDSVILQTGQGAALQKTEDPAAASASRSKTWSKSKRILWLCLVLLLVTAIGLGGWKAWQMYQRALLVYSDVNCLQQMMWGPIDVQGLDPHCAALSSQVPASATDSTDVGRLDIVIPVLTALQADLSAFQAEAQPLLRHSSSLAWIPVYGNDIASAPALVELADRLIEAALLSVDAARPLIHEFRAAESKLDPADLTGLLLEAQPQLAEARLQLDEALALRETIPAERLSPRLQSLVRDELDPVLGLADEGLSLAQALPGLLGAGSDGPKTYLLLAQNEDELRPTGGFITSVGNLVVHNGTVIRLSFADSGEQEDWSYPYPSAPWQLQEYMNSPVLILRDANWFTDFPTAALWAEYLYAYTHEHSVDGVIAFDQQFLVILLKQLGPLNIEGAPYPITADNVLAYMRQAKQPPPGESIPSDWTRKAFIGKLAQAVLHRLQEGNHDWAGVTQTLLQALGERHLLLQFDDPVAASLLAARGWDNAVRPGDADYLMVTDTNIGFNKTNAVVDVSLAYDVDLSDLDAPRATLTLLHRNNAKSNIPCIQWSRGEIDEEVDYPIDRCYWNYLRVYKQEDARLLESAPHAIPGGWMIRHENVPARVDELEEEIPGVRGFGTLLVVPGDSALNTSFQFGLPATILSPGSAPGEYVYRLKLQKQPGTLGHPLIVRIHLPNRVLLLRTPAGAVVQGDDLLLETDLCTDLELEVSFRLP